MPRIQPSKPVPPDDPNRPYRLRHHVRIVTAASLYDGHDAAINIMRRLLQAGGAEVIHLGHNRSVREIVDCAIQEDAQGVAITSYQGGHLEFFEYMHDLLRERGSAARIYGGGGGTILPDEIARLHAHGIARIFSPDDGRALGLQGMIDEVLRGCDFPTVEKADAALVAGVEARDPQAIARAITLAENLPETYAGIAPRIAALAEARRAPVLGVTGTGGSGKSSLVDELVRRYLTALPDKTVAIVSVDPSRRRTGGALLGDRIRMNAVPHPRAYMRSLATRQSNLALSKHVRESIDICKAAGFDLVIVETSGIGQSDTEIIEHSDVSLYVMTAEYGAATQLEKIDMLDFADLIAINKFDKPGSLDAIRDVRKQYRRNRTLWDVADTDLPVFATVASQFNDGGMNRLSAAVLERIEGRTGVRFDPQGGLPTRDERPPLIAAERSRYLAEICEISAAYDNFVRTQVSLARRLYQLDGTLRQFRERAGLDEPS